MRVTATYQTCGDRTLCESLTVQAAAGADMKALFELARLLTSEEPAGAALRRLVHLEATDARREAAGKEAAGVES